MHQSQQDKENQDSWDKFLNKRNAALGNNYQGKGEPSTFEIVVCYVGFGLLFSFLGAMIGGIFIVVFLVIGIFVGRAVLKSRYNK